MLETKIFTLKISKKKLGKNFVHSTYSSWRAGCVTNKDQLCEEHVDGNKLLTKDMRTCAIDGEGKKDIKNRLHPCIVR